MKIGISIGDINGIGPEIIIKSLGDDRVTKNFTPVIYGSSKIMSYYKNTIPDSRINFYHIQDADKIHTDKINVVNCWNDNVNIEVGKMNETGGKYAFIALDRAVKDLIDGKIDALVTAPINKNAMSLANFPYKGHTEYIAKMAAGQPLMMMVDDALKVALVTTHIPVSEISKKITKELVSEKLQILNETLKVDFGIERPRIAVLGLNPHAGENGVMGMEEEEIIKPAIIDSKYRGIVAMGPYPADGFFGSQDFLKFDAILAMYHDQGLIPFKTLSFEKGVNYTAGLKVIRTSPDHGTAFDIAGENKANATSFREAIYLALDISRRRKDYFEMHENPLIKKPKSIFEGEEDDEILE
ncbi:MAG TPA: 4-hydroxythreonine-4-phosphate dehydrogenase PdxA [Saprospiraceae bacterium]|nr:4-hydroxythreonine-4-phosphate dehydrogenase PdxA [Lewinellaceae bacterium]HRX28153.1 4-hydroxythreonine-4-phosphate dehydrogenase PdxA [Saprospiraceae bacterium]